jgi:hypothetical protein
MRSWYPYPPLKLMNMFVARQLPMVALGAVVFLAIRPRLQPLLPIVTLCMYYTLIHMITWTEMRYSEPLHPLLAIILVIAAREGFAFFEHRRAYPFRCGPPNSSIVSSHTFWTCRSGEPILRVRMPCRHISPPCSPP